MKAAYTEEEQAQFLAALEGEDELGMVVRAHIHVEAVLNRVIDALAAYPSAIAKMQLDYAQKVHLAVALGLTDEHTQPLLILGTIRNAFAHRPGTKLTADRVNNLYKAFSASDKQAINETYAKTKPHLENGKPSFRQLETKMQFILLVVSLRATLLVALKEVLEEV